MSELGSRDPTSERRQALPGACRPLEGVWQGRALTSSVALHNPSPPRASALPPASPRGSASVIWPLLGIEPDSQRSAQALLSSCLIPSLTGLGRLPNPGLR